MLVNAITMRFNPAAKIEIDPSTPKVLDDTTRANSAIPRPAGVIGTIPDMRNKTAAIALFKKGKLWPSARNEK